MAESSARAEVRADLFPAFAAASASNSRSRSSQIWRWLSSAARSASWALRRASRDSSFACADLISVTVCAMRNCSSRQVGESTLKRTSPTATFWYCATSRCTLPSSAAWYEPCAVGRYSNLPGTLRVRATCRYATSTKVIPRLRRTAGGTSIRFVIGAGGSWAAASSPGGCSPQPVPRRSSARTRNPVDVLRMTILISDSTRRPAFVSGPPGRDGDSPRGHAQREPRRVEAWFPARWKARP